MNRCTACGVQQERWRDTRGMERTNIDPISRLCVDCLAKAFKARQRHEQPPESFDHKAAQAGRDE